MDCGGGGWGGPWRLMKSEAFVFLRRKFRISFKQFLIHFCASNRPGPKLYHLHCLPLILQCLSSIRVLVLLLHLQQTSKEWQRKVLLYDNMSYVSSSTSSSFPSSSVSVRHSFWKLINGNWWWWPSDTNIPLMQITDKVYGSFCSFSKITKSTQK